MLTILAYLFAIVIDVPMFQRLLKYSKVVIRILNSMSTCE